MLYWLLMMENSDVERSDMEVGDMSIVLHDEEICHLIRLKENFRALFGQICFMRFYYEAL